MYRKSKNTAAQLRHMGYMGHVLMENRSALVVDLDTTEVSGAAEREAAVRMR